jgi:hypothetical protein
MNATLFRKSPALVEPLEQRIAPAVLTDLTPVVVGTPILLDANPNTPAPAGITAGLNGALLMFVEKGSCLVFTNDFNGNNQIDFNEITGIAAGDGLRLISFVDIHGDIVTNLRPDGTLTDSDGVAANGRDGQILLNSKIESIQLRSVRQDELPIGTALEDKIALSSYSIFGNIYAGGGFGTLDGGLLIDESGVAAQQARFNGDDALAVWVETKPQIGSIRVGSAASGRFFSFGAGLADETAGQLQVFTPPSNSAGADIINIRALDPSSQFNLGTLQAGDGGFNGRGGDIVNAFLNGDTAGGYGLIAGNAGPGPTGQRGGNIDNWVDFGSVTSEVIIKTGNGGQGLVGRGGDGGNITFGNILPIDHDNDPTTPPITPESAVSVAGRLKITLGDGGAGLTGGGNGGSFPTGKFTTNEPTLTFPIKTVSSWHRPGDIGQLFSVDENGAPLPNTDSRYHALRGIDFDGDGAHDIVYTTTQSGGIQANALVVLFGNPLAPGSFDPDRTLFLDAPDNPEALTVGDFNNDGRPDIAVASGTFSTQGIQVILSVYDPVDTTKFVGFSDSIYSPLPAVGGDRAQIISANTPAELPHAYSILEIASGDFDGDGATDMGVMTTLGFFMMRGDLDQGPNGTVARQFGRFFSDTASNIGGFVPADIAVVPPDDNVVGEFPVIKASALVDGGVDIVFAAVQGSQISAYTYTNAVMVLQTVSLGQVDTNRELSDMDNTVNPPRGKTDKISLADASAKDFTFLDTNGDGFAELSILTASPEGYLVNKADTNGLAFVELPSPPNPPGTFRADIFETFTSNKYDDGSPNAGLNPDENRGIRIGGRTGPSNFGLGLSDGGLVGILTHTEFNGVRNINNVMVIDYERDPDNVDPVQANILRFTAQPTPVPAGEAANFLTVSFGGAQFIEFRNPDQTVRAFDTYIANYTTLTTPPPPPPNPEPVAGPSPTTFILGGPTKDRGLPYVPVMLGSGNLLVAFLDRNGFFITAGDGGDSTNGPGGRGGSIGNSLRFDPTLGTAVGTFDIEVPAFAQFFAAVRLLAGDGGDGFRDGGAGGTLSGVSVRHAVGTDTISNSGLLLAGQGGNSIKGKGGVGGDVKAVFIEGGELFIAGQGGNGVVGGKGGSVLGNRFGLDDTLVGATRDSVESSAVAVFAGNGGAGVRLGGEGGSINGFTPRFLFNLSGTDSLLHLRAGDGGNATIGNGGRGGSVLDASPVSDGNNLNGTIFVLAGSGGNGTRGGDGGAIRDFINEGTGESTAFSTTFLAGNGGIGTSGAGGLGGSITNVRSAGTGVGFQFYFDLSNPEGLEFLGDALLPFIEIVPFSRMVAGEGGTSLGGAGGNGGSLLNVLGTSATSSFVMAGGRGGDGLSRGGHGGSVMNATANAGAEDIVASVFGFPITKPQVLIIAGEGGDAYSGVSRSTDPLVPGRKAPVAGNGGSISNFEHPVGSEVNVHLIAGNGGNTPNAGSTQDVKNKVGRGGSITNINVAGNIGDTGNPVDPDAEGPLEPDGAPIKPYNAVNERLSDFVRTSVVGTPEVPSGLGVSIPLINGQTGNVGIVVGAKGSVRDGDNDGRLDPAPDSPGSIPNGSLLNVTAANIMSAVAGHVDRIASIQVLKNVRITTVGGEYGSDRDVDTTGATQSPDGVPYSIGPIETSLDYIDSDGNHSDTPEVGGRLVDGAIVAKGSRAPQSDRDFPIG